MLSRRVGSRCALSLLLGGTSGSSVTAVRRHSPILEITDRHCASSTLGMQKRHCSTGSNDPAKTYTAFQNALPRNVQLNMDLTVGNKVDCGVAKAEATDTESVDPNEQRVKIRHFFVRPNDTEGLLEQLELRSIPQMHIEEIEAAPVWKSKAHLALVACAAKHTGCPVPDTLASLLNSTKELVGNSQCLMYAVDGDFLFLRYCTVRHESLETLVGKSIAAIETKKVLELGNGSIGRRRIVFNMIEEPLISKALNNYTENKQRSLTVVVGESGSGKTASALASVLLADKLCLYHTFSGQGNPLTGLHELARVERDAKVTEYLKKLLSELKITDDCDKSAVLILDEMGSYPTVVRSLCSIYHSLIPELQSIVKVKALHMIVAGTGVEGHDILPGSDVNTYNIIRMTNVTGEEFLTTLRKTHFCPQLQEIIQHESPYVIGQVAWRVLSNRRVAATFTSLVTRIEGVHPDWRHALPTYINMALSHAKELNGFQGKPPNECMSLFSDALAYSFGGKDQEITASDERRLMVEAGILVNNCERVKIGDKSDRWVEVSSSLREKTDVSKVVLDKKHKNRYSISVSAVENGLRCFGMVQRDLSGEGFEDSVCDLLMAQMLAGSSNVEIQNPPADALCGLKSLVRKASKGASLIVTVVLRDAAFSVAEALAKAEPTIIEEIRRRVDDAGLHSSIKVGVVIKNAKKAPSADVFAATARFYFAKGQYSRRVGEVDLQLSLQMKRYEASGLTDYALGAELYKMGDRRPFAIAGHVASTIPVDIARGKWLMPFISMHFKMMDREMVDLYAKLFSKSFLVKFAVEALRNPKLGMSSDGEDKQDPSAIALCELQRHVDEGKFDARIKIEQKKLKACFKKKNVLRQDLFRLLSAASADVKSPNTGGNFFVVAVASESPKKGSKTNTRNKADVLDLPLDVVVATLDEMSVATYPVLLAKQGQDDEAVIRQSTVSIVAG